MDCSVAKRKGCNYCLRGKNIADFISVKIDDVGKQLDIDFQQNKYEIGESIPINYCPICGKEL